MIKILLTDIDWDTSDYDDDGYDPCSPNIPDLPREVMIDETDPFVGELIGRANERSNEIGMDWDDAFMDEVKDANTYGEFVDYLSNTYGFCVNGCAYDVNLYAED